MAVQYQQQQSLSSKQFRVGEDKSDPEKTVTVLKVVFYLRFPLQCIKLRVAAARVMSLHQGLCAPA